MYERRILREERLRVAPRRSVRGADADGAWGAGAPGILLPRLSQMAPYEQATEDAVPERSFGEIDSFMPSLRRIAEEILSLIGLLTVILAIVLAALLFFQIRAAAHGF